MNRRCALLVALAAVLFYADIAVAAETDAEAGMSGIGAIGIAATAEYWYSENRDGTGRLITCSTPEGAKDDATLESVLASGHCRLGTVREYGDFRARRAREKALRSVPPVYVPMPAPVPGPGSDPFGLFTPPSPSVSCYKTAWGFTCD